MVEIIIPNKRYNRDIPNLGEDLTDEELIDICQKITGQTSFKKTLDNNWSTGRYIKLVDNDKIHFVGISGRKVSGRNSFIQTIATIFSAYINYNCRHKYLDYYFLQITGNNKTNFLKFYYRIMKTINFNFINLQVGLGNLVLEKYDDVIKLINDKNTIRKSNTANKSSFITNEGCEYRIYGKSFGANSKETALICFAISFITDKPVQLFQILDNNSKSISENDKNAILSFGKINIINDTFIFDETNDITEDNNNIRSARFIYNLLSKYGEKHCALCDCEIDNLIQAAHIWPVADIKKEHISLEEKKKYATDENNGIWLCENHHKLFDSGLITISLDGKILLSNKLNAICKKYVSFITTINCITLNEQMVNYFKLRYKL